MTEWERTQESCKHLFNAMEPKLLGVGYTARCIHCGKVSFIDLSKGAKNTEQQVQPDIGDAPAILDNTVELDGVLYCV